ncbi:MAG TPA: hypothetical protein VFZ61_09990 [Polyangiales bacterium]
MLRRRGLPFAIFLVCSLVYVAFLDRRAAAPTDNNHFVHLAHSFLQGQLGVVGNRPPGNNDWALYEGTWYVTFPPFPALVIMPAVAIWGVATRDALFWAVVAGLAPALLFLLLRRLSERGESTRGLRDNLLLTALFAFGSVFFYVAVQGTVWFAAHVVASSLITLFILFSLGAERPLLAGAACGACLLTRATTPVMALFFLVEALRTYRRESAVPGDADAHPLLQAARWVVGADWLRVTRAVALFSLPVVVALGAQLWLNAARWGDPFNSGYEYLQIGWRGRIQTWGLFNYHYLSKNLAVFLASLPWLSDPATGGLKISLHGLALWFTTPNLLWLPWPARLDARLIGLYLVAGVIAAWDLCYQNSGWVQFGYRFALDYMPFLITALALGARRFGPLFGLALLFSIVVNTFGALTFDRAHRFYDNDHSQNRVFQPD